MTDRITAAWLTRPETQAVFAALAADGHEARAVGGAVRNALIGKAASDIDIATVAAPEATMAAAERAGLAVIPTGLQHGTVTVISGGIPHEVTTLRRDIETDGRRAVVAFTDDWAADASRRDFTINALYCDADGTLFDPLSGLDDLVARRVRFIGDATARIREDHLRILRFFRFTAEYAIGPPDAIGLAACGRLREGLQKLSAERIRAELLKLLVAPRTDDVVQVMFEHGYWPALLGTVPTPLQFSRCVALTPPVGEINTAMVRLAALAITMPEEAARLANRLRLSRQQHGLLDAIARIVPLLHIDMRDHDVRLLLYRHGRPVVAAACAVAQARRPAAWSRVASALATLSAPMLPVRGQDLIDRGLTPGPAVGRILSVLETAWIESDFTLSREDLLARMEPPS